MSIQCRIIPKAAATPEQLKALGLAISNWYENELAEGQLPHWVDYGALASLLDGKTPPTLAEQLETRIVESLGRPLTDDRKKEIIQQLFGAGDAELRAIPAAVRIADRDTVIESMRHTIPADLVEDITVDNKSWNE